jgi:hypothetical protein
MKRNAIAAVVVGLLVLLIVAYYWNDGRSRTTTRQVEPCGIPCGTERWSVKTLADRDRSQVDFNPVETTVAELVSMGRPAYLPNDGRIEPVETRTFRVRALLVGFKSEADQDFHVVIADIAQPGLTMIVELPDPMCSGACASDHRQAISKVREIFVAHCGQPTSTYKRLRALLPVTVTGVGFFDFLHGQTGVAANGIELHPVLGIEFPENTDQCMSLAERSR